MSIDNYNRGDFQKAADKFELALVLAVTSEEGGPRLINSYLNLALAYEGLKRDSESEKLYLEAIRLQEKDYGIACEYPEVYWPNEFHFGQLEI